MKNLIYVDYFAKNLEDSCVNINDTYICRIKELVKMYPDDVNRIKEDGGIHLFKLMDEYIKLNTHGLSCDDGTASTLLAFLLNCYVIDIDFLKSLKKIM